MPNQMIALQARNPQLPDPAAQTAKFVNMMNMTKQQEAAERQAMQAQQAMEFARTGEARAVETQAATMRDKDLDYQIKDIKRLRNIGVAIMQTEDPTAREAAYQNWVGMVEQSDKQLGATLRQVARNFDPKIMQSVLMEADKFIDKTVATPVASLELGVDGSPRSVQVGGLPGTASQSPVYDAPEMGAPPRPAQTPTNPMSRNAPAPNAAGEAPGSLGLVVASALQTRVMSQADLDKMLANVQPASRPKIMNWVRENGISVADAPPLVDNQMRDTPMSYDGRTPQSQFAVMRGQPMQSQTAGLAGAPEMQQTMAQTQPRTVTKLQQRNPNVSPAPGIYGVPTQDVAATSRATRPSKQELYDAEAAKIQAARDAGPPPVTAQQKIARRTEVAQAYSKAQTLIDKAYNPKEGIISIANKIKSLSPDQKEAITGYSGYVPSFRESSREADTLFGNLKGVVTSLGKDAAAASGAVGNMAVQEWKIAADMIANLDLAGMTPRALDAQMDRIIEQVSNATKLAERVYGIQYGEDVKQYPAFKLRGTPPARTKTPVVKGGTRLSPDIDKILKSRGI